MEFDAIEVDVGYIITLDDGRKMLLLERTDDGYYAVGVDGDDNPDDTLFVLREYWENDELYMKVEKEFSIR